MRIKSFHKSLLSTIESAKALSIINLLFFIIYKGLHNRPPSVHICISLYCIYHAMEINGLIIPFLLNFLNSITKSFGSNVCPYQSPLTNTFTLLNTSIGLNASNDLTPYSSKNALTGSLIHGIVI